MKKFNLWFTGENGGVVYVEFNKDNIITVAEFYSKNLADDIEPATVGQMWLEYVNSMKTLAGLLGVDLIIQEVIEEEDDVLAEPAWTIPHGFIYTDEHGNECWTEDFESSIGE